MSIIKDQNRIELCRKEVAELSQPVPFAGCWLWLGNMHRKGYGRLRRTYVNGDKQTFAHRFSYAAFHGEPGDSVVMHTCDTPLCVNPDHLRAGTVADNNADRSAKNRSAKRRNVKRRSCGGKHLSPVTVEQVCALSEFGYSQQAIAKMVNASQSTVWRRLKAGAR